MVKFSLSIQINYDYKIIHHFEAILDIFELVF